MVYLPLAVVTLSLGMAVAAITPSVYWVSSPNHFNETVVVAGAGFDAATTARLCRDEACTKVLDPSPVIEAWDESLKMVMPSTCTAPCYMQIAESTTFAINSPDVWWAISNRPASVPVPTSPEAAAATAAMLSDEPLRVTVVAGNSLRVFGRSLAWSSTGGVSSCISAADTPGPVLSTTLEVGSGKMTIEATLANCYEAEFSLTELQPAVYAVKVVTPWGPSQEIALTVIPTPVPTIHTIDMSSQFNGNLTSAINAAATIVDADDNAEVKILMAAEEYNIIVGLALPNRTSLIGMGVGKTVIVYDGNPPRPPSPPPQCTKPVLADFYTVACKNRGCSLRPCPGCFLEISVNHTAYSADGCCAACGADLRCNAWTFIGSVDKPGGYCALRSCPDEPSPVHNTSCAITPSSPGLGNRTSGWIVNRVPAPFTPNSQAVIYINGQHNQLVNFSLRVKTAKPLLPAIWAAQNATEFVATGLNVTLLQNPVSNAFKIEAIGYEITNNTMNQVGPCNAPNYGPGSDATPFQPSVTIYLHNSRAGRMQDNTVYWRCSAYDLDVSDRVTFENNNIICTEPHVVPHGNSISGYDWRLHPSSRWWSIARNNLVRPPYQKGDEQNWIQRETMTTDGSGAYGTANLLSTNGNTVMLKWLVYASKPLLGTTLLVLDGPGKGQSRLVTGIGSDNGTVTLDGPLDGFVANANSNRPSTLAIISSFGSKLIVGNKFNWTEVVQWYGNTLRGVAADNSFSNCNVKSGGNDGGGALGGVGECYHGSDPNYFTEYRGNTMYASDGISLMDSYNVREYQCAAYGGPWVSWAVIRSNAFSGISMAARNISSTTPSCAHVTVHGAIGKTGNTSNIVAEQNSFSCPPPGVPGEYAFYNCAHCTRR